MIAALCQCNGDAIGSNQDYVCEFLLGEDEYKHLLIDVRKRPETGRHYAIFREQEILDKNNGKPMEVDIENMESELTEVGEARLYYYFIAMIDLISLMCLSRNYAGIKDLNSLYPIDFVIDCFLNEKISYPLRSNLAKVLISLHIDKDPLEQINVPILTRVW